MTRIGDTDVSRNSVGRLVGQVIFLSICWSIAVGAICAAIRQPDRPETRFIAGRSLSANSRLPTLSAESAAVVERPIELLRPTPSPRPTYVRMEVTAYCPCPICCGRNANGLTASGAKVTAAGGRFVAAPEDLPFGSKLIVPGYNGDKPVPVLDRGGAIKGTHLDVFFPTHDQAKQWGRKSLPVAIVSR